MIEESELLEDDFFEDFDGASMLNIDATKENKFSSRPVNLGKDAK